MSGYSCYDLEMIKRTCLYSGCGVLVDRGYCEKHATRERYCNQPGCKIIITDGYWCADHLPAKQHDIRRGNAASRGYDWQWCKFARIYLIGNPLCRRCQTRGLITPAVLPHHIIPLADGGAKYDTDNLMPVCRRCHDAIHSGSNL